MRSHVFTDAALVKHAGRFVWLEVDYENKANAPFLEAFPIDGLPTVMIIDPAPERVILRWLGSADVPMLERLFDDATRALSPEAPALVDALARADRLNGEQKHVEAAAAYRALLESAPDDWSRRTRVVESLVFSLALAGDNDACVALALEQAPRLRGTSSFGNTVANGLGCALDVDNQEAVATLEPMVLEAAHMAQLLGDDRSSFYSLLVQTRAYLGDETGAKTLAWEWLEFLEAEAARSRTPAARSAFDSHRLSAASWNDAWARVIPALEASERDFPEDANGPARLAVVYRELERYDEAVAASERALTLVHGPRRIRVLTTLAGIHHLRGDLEAEIGALEEGIAFAKSLPPGQYSMRRVVSLKKKLAALEMSVE